MHDKVLVREQPSSHAIAGVTVKFIRPFEEPYMISMVIPPFTVEVCDNNVNIQVNLTGNSGV